MSYHDLTSHELGGI
jgi:hypothetical protein